MSRLSKANRYAIMWLNSQNLNTDEIYNELKISKSQIEKVLHTKDIKASSKIKAKQSPVKAKARTLMINETAGKHSNTVSIMTQEASEYNDSKKINKIRPSETDFIINK